VKLLPKGRNRKFKPHRILTYYGTIQLLRDVLFSPYAVVERIILEIKEDKDKKLLQELLSEFSSEFAEHIRKN
jgi:hypothetical protein